MAAVRVLRHSIMAAGTGIFVVKAAIPEKELPTKKLIRPSELPIYDERDENLVSRFSQSKPGSVESAITEIRQTVCGWMEVIEGSGERAVRFVGTGVAHTKDVYDYIRDDSNILARAGLITLGGLGGLLVGARGGFFKKVFYSGVGMGTLASLCYPKEAVQVSQDAYKISKYYAFVAYNKIQGESGKSGAKVAAKKSIDTIGEQNTDRRNEDGSKVALQDFGQSNSEDKDMYTTRGTK